LLKKNYIKKSKLNKEKEKNSSENNSNSNQNNHIHSENSSEENSITELTEKPAAYLKINLLSDLRQITEEESIKKSSSIQPKKDCFNWDYYTKYILNRRQSLNSVEEEQMKQAKLPGSGNIWKNNLTIPEGVNLKTNKTPNNLDSNNINNNLTITNRKKIFMNGNENSQYLSSHRNITNNEKSFYNINNQYQKLNNVKVKKFI